MTISLTPKRAAALIEFTSWPSSRPYRRKPASMQMLSRAGLVKRDEAVCWIFTDRGREVAWAMIYLGQAMIQNDAAASFGDDAA